MGETINQSSLLRLIAPFGFANANSLLLIAGIIGACGAGVCTPIFTLVFGSLVDDFGNNFGNTAAMQDIIEGNIINIIYIGLGACAAGYLQVTALNIYGARTVAKLRSTYLSAALKQDSVFFDTNSKDATSKDDDTSTASSTNTSNGSTGTVISGLSEDAKTVQLTISDKTGATLYNVAMGIAGLSIALVRGWQMTLVLMACTPLIAILGYLLALYMESYSKKINAAYADANNIASQALGNVRTVYSLNAEQGTVDTYESSLKMPLKVGVRQGTVGGLTVGATMCVFYLSCALALWYGGERVIDGDMSGGDVLSVLFAALIAGFSAGQAAPSIQYFQQGKAASSRMFQVIDRRPEIDINDNGGDKPKDDDVSGHLLLDAVTFSYPARPLTPVLNGIYLDMAPGKSVALVGGSGHGKSTIIALLQRLYDPSGGGSVQLDGRDYRSLNLGWLRSQMGLVSQEPILFATTIRQNIIFGLGTTPGNVTTSLDDAVIAAAKAANAHEFITALPLGYETHVGEKGLQLSGGQKQRIAIARAMIRKPKILLLDEATSALDSKSEGIVQKALDELMKGRTSVVVAHRLSTVRKCDKIAVIQNGVVAEEGEHGELLKKEGSLYAALVHMQGLGDVGKKLGDGVGIIDLKDEAEEDIGIGSQLKQASPPTAEGSLLSSSSSTHSDAPASALKHLSFEGIGEAAMDIARRGVVPVSSSGGGAVIEAVAVAPPFAGAGAAQGWRRFASMKFKQNKEGHRSASLTTNKKNMKTIKSTSTKKKSTETTTKRLLQLNRPELKWALLGLVGSAVLGLILPFFAVSLSNLIADLFGTLQQIEDGVRKWCLVFVGLGVAALVASVCQGHAFNLMGQHLAKRVRVLTMQSLLRQEVGWYDKQENSSGVLTSQLGADALDVRGQLGDTAGLLTQNLVTFISGIVIALTANWKLALVVAACIPLILIAAVIQIRLFEEFTQGETTNFAAANQIASEAVGAINTVSAFSLQDKVTELYAEQLSELSKKAERSSHAAGFSLGLSHFLLYGIYALAFWYAGVLMSECSPSSALSCFADIMQAFFAIFMAAVGVAQGQLYFPSVARGKAASERIFRILDRQSAIDSADPNGDRLTEVTGQIHFNLVSFYYPQRPEVMILDEFTLAIPAGSSIALVGQSGEGKSTIIQLLERFYDPTSGSITLDGIDLKNLNLKWLRKQIGLVSQEPVMFSMNILENIRLGRPEASMEDVIAAAKAAGAAEFIEALPDGYHTKMNEGGRMQVSGGQKQRICIARALIRRPKILLLDEYTAALDAKTESDVTGAMQHMQQSGGGLGITTITVAHRLVTVKNSDIIAVVHQGKVLEQGSHTELMGRRDGAYRKLVKHQSLQRTGSTIDEG
jgi:ATP-binding cassette, subfamily B (MDR/TAP), member 1